MKKLLLLIAILCFAYVVNAQIRPTKIGDGVILKPDNKLKKRVVNWVCKVEGLSTSQLKIEAKVIPLPGKNESIVTTSNLDLERLEFYNYDNKKAITIGVIGSGELFKTYTFDFSGMYGALDKGFKVLCYFKGSTKPDATIVVIPLITFK